MSTQNIREIKLPHTAELVAAKVAQRCYEDPGFRKALLQNPREALEKEIGKKLEGDAEILVHRNDENTWHIPVTDDPDCSKPLSDEQLAKIAAGEGPIFLVPIGIGTIVGLVAAGVGAGLAAAAITATIGVGAVTIHDLQN